MTSYDSERYGRHSLGLRRLDFSWMSPFIVMLIIAVGVFCAKFVLKSPVYYVIGLSLVTIIVLILANNIELGLFAYMFIAAFGFGESPGVQSPNSHYKAGLLPSELLLMLLIAIWIVGRFFKGEKPKWVTSAINLPLILFGFTAILSVALNNLLVGAKRLEHLLLITQIAEVGLLWCTIGAFFLFANALRNEKWIGRLFTPIVLIGVYVGTAQLLHVHPPIPTTWGPFLVGSALCFLYSRLLFDSLSSGKKVLFTSLTLILTAATYVNLSWVSGWLAVSVALLIITFYKSKTLAVSMIILGAFVMFVYPGIYGNVQKEAEDGGDYDRLIIWQDAYHTVMEVNPVLGIGPGNYAAYAYEHSTLWWANNQKTYTTAHNNYVGILAEDGFVGLFMFIWVILAGIVSGHKASKRSPPEFKWLAISATAMFAGVAVACIGGDYLFPSRGNNGIVHFGTTVYVWLILGAAVAAANLPGNTDS